MRILQAQPAHTRPYSDFVSNLPERLTWVEEWLRKLIGNEITNGISLFFRRSSFEAVVTCDYRTAILFGTLNRLPGNQPLHVVKELYLDERVLSSPLRRAVFRWALRNCAAIVTNCSAERNAYSSFLNLPFERFHFLPWPSNIPVSVDPEDDGYVFAAGRSFRDWKLLMEAARIVKSVPFVVIAERADVEGLPLPENVTLYCDIPRADYLDLLQKARLVVIPLKDTARSTGQATILEAMSMGKAVVAARTAGTVDYVLPNQSGLLYEPGNVASLAQQIQHLLDNPTMAKRLARHGVELVQRIYNKSRYNRDMVVFMRKLITQHHPHIPDPRSECLRAAASHKSERNPESTMKELLMNKNIAVLIPCLNEEKTISKVVHDFREELPDAAIHVYDNASTDATAQLAREAGAIVHMEPRKGKGNVVRSMFREIDADIYVMVDGDDTYPAEAVHDLIQETANGNADMVVGSRFLDRLSSFRMMNRLGNQFFRKSINLLFGSQLTDVLSGYRAMNHSLVKGMPMLATGFEVEVELTIKSLERGYRLCEQPCRLRNRPIDSYSKIRKIQDGYLISSCILGLLKAYRPLVFFGIPAALAVFLSLVPGGIALVQAFKGNTVPMYLILVTTAMFFVGLGTLLAGLVLESANTRFREIDYLLRRGTHQSIADSKSEADQPNVVLSA